MAGIEGTTKTSKNDERTNTIGLAISGGIKVAATGGAATMRGFQQQTITINGEKRPAMEAFDFISGLSGGVVPTLLYPYAQNVTTEELLDSDYRLDDPSQITPQALDRKTSKPTLFDNAVESATFKSLPMIIYGLFCCKLHSIFTLVQWFATLDPFGIKRDQKISPHPHPTEKKTIGPRPGIKAIPLVNFMAMGKADGVAQDTIEGYFKLVTKLKEKYGNQFVETDQLMQLIRDVDDPDLFIPFIASPTDVRNAMPDSEWNQINVNSIPTSEWGGNDTSCSVEFFLGMATNFVGMGGIQEEVESFQYEFLRKLSQKRTVRLEHGSKTKKEMLFVDGGFIDGLGVPALVQRKVRTIIATIWPHGLARDYEEHYEKAKGKNLDVWLEHAVDLAFGDIASYFGYYKDYAWYKNRMFEDGRARLEQLRNDVDTLYEAGKPIVVTMKGLKTINNPFWGIEQGHTVDLTIIYWTLPKDFAEKVPIESVPPPIDETTGKPMNKLDKTGRSFTNEEFKDFPNFPGKSNFEYSNKFLSIYKFTCLTRRQANMSGR